MQLLKIATAVTVKLGPFVDATDGVTAETGLTIAQADIRLSKNGGDYAQTHNATGATHDENGYYDVPLDTTDTGTVGRLRVSVSVAGALPVWQDFMVVPAHVYDSVVLGTDLLDVRADEVNDKTGYSLADGAITAAKIATDAISADKIAADAVSKLQAGLSTLTAQDVADAAKLAPSAGAAAIGSLKAQVDACVSQSSSAAVNSGMVNSRLPANPAAVGSAMTLANGAITADVVATGAIDADAIAADAVTKLQAGLSTLTAQDVADAAKLTLSPGDADIGSLKYQVDACASEANKAALYSILVNARLPANPAAVGSAMTLTPEERTAVRMEMETAGGKLALIDAKTTNLPASPAAVGSAMTLTAGERTTLAAALEAAIEATIGSISETLSRIESNTSAGTITVRSFVADDGSAIIYSGMDHVGVTALSWSVDGWHGPDLSSGSVVLRLISRRRWQENIRIADFEFAAEASMVGQNGTIVVELTREKSGQLVIGQQAYRYQLVHVAATGGVTLIQEGWADINNVMDVPE